MSTMSGLRLYPSNVLEVLSHDENVFVWVYVHYAEELVC